MTPADIVLALETLLLEANHIPCSPDTGMAFHTIVLGLGITGGRRDMILDMKFEQVQLGVIKDKARIGQLSLFGMGRSSLKMHA